MNKVEIAEHVVKRTGLPKSAAVDAVEATLAAIAVALKRGEDVRIAHFGSFSVRERAAGVGRNPVTGEKMSIPASRSAHFRPAPALKSELNRKKSTPGKKTSRTP